MASEGLDCIEIEVEKVVVAAVKRALSLLVMVPGVEGCDLDAACGS